MSGESKRKGPSLRVVASCMGCEHERSVSYCVEDGNDVDSGHYVYCDHPDSPGEEKARIGDTTWTTPAWCPLYADARAALLASMVTS